MVSRQNLTAHFSAHVFFTQTVQDMCQHRIQMKTSDILVVMVFVKIK